MVYKPLLLLLQKNRQLHISLLLLRTPPCALGGGAVSDGGHAAGETAAEERHARLHERLRGGGGLGETVGGRGARIRSGSGTGALGETVGGRGSFAPRAASASAVAFSSAALLASSSRFLACSCNICFF